MGNRTAAELVNDFKKLATGLERDVKRYEDKIAVIEKSQADYAALEAALKAAIADRANLTADKVSELAAAAGTLTPQLVAAHDYVTQKTKTGSNKNIMANEPGWITEDVAKAKTAINAILSDLGKLAPAERDQAKRDMIGIMYPADMLLANPELYNRALPDVWKDYAYGVATRLKAIKDKPVDIIKHPEVLDKEKAAIDALLKQLAAAYDQAEKSRQKKGPPAPRMIRTLIPHMPYFHR